MVTSVLTSAITAALTIFRAHRLKTQNCASVATCTAALPSLLPPPPHCAESHVTFFPPPRPNQNVCSSCKSEDFARAFFPRVGEDYFPMLRLCAAVQVSGQAYYPPNSGAGTISGNMKSGWREGCVLFPNSRIPRPGPTVFVLRVTSSFLVSTRKVDRKIERKKLCVVAQWRVCCVSCCASVAILDTSCEQTKNTRIQNVGRKRD